MKGGTSNHFHELLVILVILPEAKFLLLFTNPFVEINSYELSLFCKEKSSKIGVVTSNYLVLAGRSSKECTQNYFCQICKFFSTYFTLDQFFTSICQSFSLNRLIRTVPLMQGSPSPYSKVSFLYFCDL